MTQSKRMSAERKVELDAIVDAIDDHATDPAERALCDAWTEVRALRAERDEARNDRALIAACVDSDRARADRAEAERDALAAQLGALAAQLDEGQRVARCIGSPICLVPADGEHPTSHGLRCPREWAAHARAAHARAALASPATAAAERDARLRAAGAAAALRDAAAALDEVDGNSLECEDREEIPAWLRDRADALAKGTP